MRRRKRYTEGKIEERSRGRQRGREGGRDLM